MYNILCELTPPKIIFTISFLLFTIGDYMIHGIGYDFYLSLILLILFVAISITSILKYLSLKKHGVIVNNVPYEIDKHNNNSYLIVVNYTNASGNLIKLYKKYPLPDITKIQERGTLSILINPNKEKQYYVFDPITNQ